MCVETSVQKFVIEASNTLSGWDEKWPVEWNTGRTVATVRIRLSKSPEFAGFDSDLLRHLEGLAEAEGLKTVQWFPWAKGLKIVLRERKVSE